MYLEHFGLKEFPFSLTPDTQYFTKLPQHQEAMNVVLVGLQNGEGFIKITGEVGTGKTILCRRLLSMLDEEFMTVYIPNPELSPLLLYHAVADELGIASETEHDAHSLLKAITATLILLNKEGKRVVLLIDEAQAMPEDTMETLRLLTNLETEKAKLMQVVLFGQPELDTLLSLPTLRQLKQRITFSYNLKPLTQKLLDFYLAHRMRVAGFDGISLFKTKSIKMLSAGSGGIPRLINILCHKALLVAYGMGDRTITPSHIKQAIADTESALMPTSEFSWGSIKNVLSDWKTWTWMSGIALIISLTLYILTQ